MLSKAKVKNDRGFYHPITAALLCPVKYPKTPQLVFILYSCVASYSNFNYRTIEAIRAGTLPVTAQLLPCFLFPDDHVYDKNDISLNVLRGHIMIRVFLLYTFLLMKLQLLLGRKASLSRPINCSRATWCSPWKTGKCSIMWLDINDASYDCICGHTGMSTILRFFLSINI